MRRVWFHSLRPTAVCAIVRAFLGVFVLWLRLRAGLQQAEYPAAELTGGHVGGAATTSPDATHPQLSIKTEGGVGGSGRGWLVLVLALVLASTPAYGL